MNNKLWDELIELEEQAESILIGPSKASAHMPIFKPAIVERFPVAGGVTEHQRLITEVLAPAGTTPRGWRIAMVGDAEDLHVAVGIKGHLIPHAKKLGAREGSLGYQINSYAAYLKRNNFAIVKKKTGKINSNSRRKSAM